MFLLCALKCCHVILQAGSGLAAQQQRSQTPPAGATESTREPVHPPPEGPPYMGETKPADEDLPEPRTPYH